MKLRHYIFALGLMSSLGACNDDFMERYPLDVPTDETFWTSESDLKLFLNKFYPTWIQGHASGWSDSKYLYPLPVTGSPLVYGDDIVIMLFVQEMNSVNWVKIIKSRQVQVPVQMDGLGVIYEMSIIS